MKFFCLHFTAADCLRNSSDKNSSISNDKLIIQHASKKLQPKSIKIDSSFGFVELQNPINKNFIVQFCPQTNERQSRTQDGVVLTETGMKTVKVISPERCTIDASNSSFCIRNFNPSSPIKLGIRKFINFKTFIQFKNLQAAAFTRNLIPVGACLESPRSHPKKIF